VTKYCIQCDNQFVTKNKNQIYCSAECRSVATKEKILQRYKYSKTQSRLGKTRLCAGGCGTKISIYNDAGFCESCGMSNKKLNQALKEIKRYFDYEQMD
jgi:hypothetical protein